MIRRLLISLLPPLVLTGCTTILPLTEEDGKTTDVQWNFAWQDGVPDRQPDVFTVALLRTFSPEHLMYSVDPQDAKPVTLSIGDYLAVGAGCVPEDAYTLVYDRELGDKADAEADTGTWDPSGLYAVSPVLTTGQIDEQYGSHAWLDPSFPVLPDANPLFLAKAHKELLGKQEPEILELATKSVVQGITIRCILQTEGDIVIDEVTASICGTARRVQVISGAVNFNNGQLGQNLFFMENIGGGTWQGSFHCLGLFPAEQDDFAFGPGMLQLHIHASTGPVTRYLEARFNLKNLIEQAQILQNPAGSSYYTITNHSATLTIDTPLEISEESIHADGEIFIEWEENDIYTDENGDPLEF